MLRVGKLLYTLPVDYSWEIVQENVFVIMNNSLIFKQV
jgi:hypothetical protein